MSKKNICRLIILSFFFLTNCNRLTNPYSLAPDAPNSSWHLVKTKSIKFCQPVVPYSLTDQELTLAEVLDIALLNNPLTKETWGKAREAASEYSASLHNYLPSLDFSASYARSRTSTIVLQRTIQYSYITRVNPELNLTYTIFDFGQRKYTSEQARQALYYADFSHNQKLQFITDIVMNDYYDYQYQQQYLAALLADLQDAEASLDATMQKYQLGLAAIGDISQARTKYLKVKMSISEQKRELESSFAQLASDAGLPANMEFKIQPFPEKVYVSTLLESVDELIAKAQNQRQDYLAAQAEVFEKQAAVYYARSQHYPKLDSGLDIGRMFYNHGIQENYHFTALFKLSMPLFTGFYYKNKEKAAMAQLSTAKAKLEQSEISIIKDVATSHFDVISTGETIVDAEHYLEAAQEEFKISLSSYKVGTASILDVLSAQSSLADARAKNAKAKKDWFVSLASLAYSTGSLSNEVKK